MLDTGISRQKRILNCKIVWTQN